VTAATPQDRHSLDNTWFTEPSTRPGPHFRSSWASAYTPSRPLPEVEIFKTETFGYLMTSRLHHGLDPRHFLYHEMMSHPALNSHPAPATCGVGGGDSAPARGAQAPEVRRAVQVEIDERVTRLSEQYFPELCVANGDRAPACSRDGIAWMKEARRRAWT